jgi:hypothetical protein
MFRQQRYLAGSSLNLKNEGVQMVFFADPLRRPSRRPPIFRLRNVCAPPHTWNSIVLMHTSEHTRGLRLLFIWFVISSSHAKCPWDLGRCSVEQ